VLGIRGAAMGFAFLENMYLLRPPLLSMAPGPSLRAEARVKNLKTLDPKP